MTQGEINDVNSDDTAQNPHKNREGTAACISVGIGMFLAYAFLAPELLGDVVWIPLCALLLISSAFLLNRRPRIFDCFYLVAALCMMQLTSQEIARTMFDGHMAVFLDQGDSVMRGQYPHIDIFTFYGGLNDAIAGLAMWLFGPSYLSIQITATLFAWFGLASIYLVGICVMPRWAAAWAGILFIFMHGITALFWPNVIVGGMAPIVAALLFFAFRNQNRYKWWLLVLAGFIAGFMPYSRSQGIFQIASALAGVVIVEFVRAAPRRQILLSALSFSAGVMLGGGVVTVLLCLTIGPSELLYQLAGYGSKIASAPTPELKLDWYKAPFAVLAKLIKPLWSARRHSFDNDFVQFGDFNFLFFLAVVASFIPFWRYLFGGSGKKCDLDAGAMACFLIGIVLAPSLSMAYPHYDAFRLGAAVAGAVFIPIYWLWHSFARSYSNNSRSWLIPTAVVLLCCVPMMQRGVNWARRAASSAKAEITGYPDYKSNLIAPAMQGRYMPSRLAAEDAAVAFALEKYEELYPDTPIVGIHWAGGYAWLNNLFLIGRRNYVRQHFYRQPVLTRFSQVRHDAFRKATNEYFERNPALLVSHQHNSFRDFPATKDYRALYYARQLAMGIYGPAERAERFLNATIRCFSLEQPKSVTELAKASPGVLAEQDGKLMIQKAGAVPLSFILPAIGKRYVNIKPWLVVGLEGNTNENIASVKLMCHRQDQQQPTLTRNIAGNGGKTFFLLEHAGPELWTLDFPEEAVGMCLSTLDLYALQPQFIINDGIAKTNASYGLYKRTHPTEQKSSWVTSANGNIECDNVNVKSNMLGVVTFAMEYNGPELKGNGATFRLEIVDGDETTTNSWWLQTKDFDKNFDQWQEKSFDLSAFSNRTVKLRFKVDPLETKDGSKPGGMSLYVVRPINTYYTKD